MNYHSYDDRIVPEGLRNTIRDLPGMYAADIDGAIVSAFDEAAIIWTESERQKRLKEIRENI